MSEVFVAKLNSTGSAFIYSTYLGGAGEDVPFACDVDSAGNAYVTGRTNSSDFPTANAVESAFSGGNDVFVTKLNATGSAFV